MSHFKKLVCCIFANVIKFKPFTGNYKVQLYDPRTNGFAPSSPGIGMHVEVRDPEDKIILSKVYSSEGKWTFTSHTPGEHVICLYTNSTKWFSGTQLVRFSLFILSSNSAMSLLEG